MGRTITVLVSLAMALVLLWAAGCSEDETAKATPIPSATAVSTASASASAAPATSVALLDDDGIPIPPEPVLSVSASATPPPPASAAKAPAPEPKSQPAPTPSPKTKPEPVAAPEPKPAPPPVPAAKPGTADEMADKVDAIYKPIKRFRARFEQKYVAKVAGTTKRSSGVVFVERPDKLSLSYHEPNKNRVVSDGKQLKIYEHDNQQMFIKPVAQTEYPGAFSFIMGKGLRANFTFSFHEAAQWEGGKVLVGRPRTPNPGYKVVLFYIDEQLLQKGDPGCVRRVLVVDAQGNRNRFDFLHIEQPESIPAKEFRFEPPPGTTILK